MHLALAAAESGVDSLIDRPVFVFGVPRSGTTLTQTMLASHPDLAWASQFTNRIPSRPELAVLSRVLDIGAVRRHMPARWPITPRPTEPYQLLDLVTNSAFTRPRPLTGSDVDADAVTRYRRVVRKHVHWQGKSRFIQKHTGFPRTRYLRAIFPDGRFLHVLRDGRAVANSLAHVGFFDGTMSTWWWGPMRPEFEQEYLESGKSAIVLAAITWKTLIDIIEVAMSELPSEQGMTLRYDQLIARPEEVMAEVAEFCGLEMSPAFRKRLQAIHLSGSDGKWRQLPREERDQLEASLGDHLARLGFS